MGSDDLNKTDFRNESNYYRLKIFSLLSVILSSLLFMNGYIANNYREERTLGNISDDYSYRNSAATAIYSFLISGKYYPLNTNAYAQSDEPVLRYSNASGNPVINIPGFTTEVVTEGLQLPTSMAILGPNDILVLEKDKGTVLRIINGQAQSEPLIDVNVANAVEECMCGIAISKNDFTAEGGVNKTYVFIYYTESENQDGGNPIANRLYRYEFVDGQLINPKLLLDLPALPGPRHNGGAIRIGPDNNVYVPIGDVNKTEVQLTHKIILKIQLMEQVGS